MPDLPLLSVVMAVHNGGSGLSHTIAGLRAQTYRDFELIIVDDGSSDRTWEALSTLEFPRLRVHRNAANKGQTASLKLALELAQGHYIARHDAEDISHPERFERQVAFLEAHPDVALVGSQVDWVDREGGLVRKFEYPTTHQDIVERLRAKNSFGHGAVTARREVLDELGGYRPAFRLAQDYDLWLRIGEQHELANLPETLYRMRFSARMVSVARNAEQNAYAALARQLAAERSERGQEQTDVNAAGGAIAARYARMNALARRMERATNYINWAERLLWWGGPAARYAWPLWTYALTAWPFSVRVWKFVGRQALRPSHPVSERDGR